ncbi:MAG: hypothetical protein R2789_14845 [Microthrixaceae bacterium]
MGNQFGGVKYNRRTGLTDPQRWSPRTLPSFGSPQLLSDADVNGAIVNTTGAIGPASCSSAMAEAARQR